MTHSLDFVGLAEKLFLLRHLVAGNKEICRRAQLYQGTQREPSEDWEDASGRLRYFVSNDLIECAAKMRVILDAATSQMEPGNLGRLDDECMGEERLGRVLVGEFRLTFRESCNKIIHATNFELVFENARNTRPRYLYSYWNGICLCGGTYSRKPWRVALDVYRWTDVMDSLLLELSHELEW